MIEGFAADGDGAERGPDTLELTFECDTQTLSGGDDLLALMLELETDGARRPESDALVTPDGQVVLRFDEATALVLRGMADELSEAQLEAARVDYEVFV